MLILKKLYQFNVPVHELINIYVLYVRSVVEQSAVVWHSSITKGEQRDLERTQKVALRIILKDSYTSYPEALKLSGLDNLSERRSKLCLKFPLNNNVLNTRHCEQFYVTYTRTDRLANSAIPFMQRLPVNMYEFGVSSTKHKKAAYKILIHVNSELLLIPSLK